MNLEELRQNAMDLINEHFAECVEEIDSWNGWLDDNRLFSMDELDELHYGLKLSDVLSRIDKNNFSFSDDYWYYDAYGWLCSYSGDLDEYYKDFYDAEDVLDALLNCYRNLDLAWINHELDEAVKAVLDYDDGEDEQE